jgi:DNA-3-methyladenine glycosylase II
MAGLDANNIRAARARLAGLDEALARADAATPEFHWRTRDGGYAGLLRILVNQQVSNASAAAIWARIEAGLGQVTATNVLRLDNEGLKGFGLSGPKARYALSIAEAEREGAIDFEALADLDDAGAIAALCSLTGVGRWTAEVYLSFCEGRLDFFPAGDVALQEALRLADRSEHRLTEKQLYRRAGHWRPHRGVAAHLLWAYYGGVKRGEIDPG